MPGVALMRALPIVALDVSSAADALRLVSRLRGTCDYFKVGSELFTATGPDVVRALREEGHAVFLDLKLHDIPNTVRGAARAAAALGVSLLTVHASGGEDMVRAAVDGAGSQCGILAVTVLTSLDADRLASSWGRQSLVVEDEVVRLADLAQRSGAHGVVCSGEEVQAVKSRFGDGLAALVPGIRFADGAPHDQARMVTPSGAVAAGARYVVLGRAVTEAVDPRIAMERVWAEIGGRARD